MPEGKKHRAFSSEKGAATATTGGPAPASPPPLISIITITYNDGPGLERTILSVASQKDASTEFIVVDGGSTDETPDILCRFANCIDTSLSEPDEGISDAFNKGLNLATGRYVIFLNAGDMLSTAYTLRDATRLLIEGDYDCVIGRIAYTHGPNKVGPPVKIPNAIRRQLLRNYWPHQAMFIRRDLFSAIGGYRTDFRLGMDYEWSLRLLFSAKRRNIRHIPDVIAHMAWGGRSMSNYKQTFIAYHRARKLHLNQFSAVSLALSYFFMLKRGLGNRLRGRIEH